MPTIKAPWSPKSKNMLELLMEQYCKPYSPPDEGYTKSLQDLPPYERPPVETGQLRNVMSALVGGGPESDVMGLGMNPLAVGMSKLIKPGLGTLMNTFKPGMKVKERIGNELKDFIVIGEKAYPINKAGVIIGEEVPKKTIDAMIDRMVSKNPDILFRKESTTSPKRGTDLFKSGQ